MENSSSIIGHWANNDRKKKKKKTVAQFRVLSNKMLYAWSILLILIFTSFSKTTLLQTEPILTTFYLVNSSPLLVTKYAFLCWQLFWVINNIASGAFKFKPNRRTRPIYFMTDTCPMSRTLTLKEHVNPSRLNVNTIFVGTRWMFTKMFPENSSMVLSPFRFHHRLF